MKPIFYTSNDYGAPQINNTWGSLVKMLKTVLVDGFGDMAGVTVERIDDITLKVTTPTEYPVSLESIIFFKGTVEHDNTRFTVKSIESPNIFIAKSYDNTDLSYFDTPDLTLTLTHKSLGYGLKYDNIETQGKAVFTNRNDWNLRVHDEFPKENNLWNASWAKGARISWGREMSDIDTWSTKPRNQFASRPDSWKQPTYVGGTNQNYLKLSENVWYYSTGVMTSNVMSSVIDTNMNNKHWMILGTDTTFYLWVGTSTSLYPSASHCYGFGEFDSFLNNDYNNAFLISWVGTNTSTFYTYTNASVFNWQAYSYQNDVDDTFQYKMLQLATPYTQMQGLSPRHGNTTWLMAGSKYDSYSGLSDSFNLMALDNATMMYSPMYIEEYPYILRGKHKGVYAILNNILNISRVVCETGLYFTVDKYTNDELNDKKLLIKTQGYLYNSTATNTVSVMFDMDEDWG